MHQLRILRPGARPSSDAFQKHHAPHARIALVLYVIREPGGGPVPAPTRRSWKNAPLHQHGSEGPRGLGQAAPQYQTTVGTPAALNKL